MLRSKIPMATFVACCLVMLLNLFSAMVNWLAFEHRKQMFAQMNELVGRIEAVERKTDTSTQPLPTQRGHR